VHSSISDNERLSTGGRLKKVLFTVAVTAAFAFGVYSLFLASANASKVKPLAEEGLVRTATAKDDDQIALALGAMVEPELVYVVVDDPLGPPDPDLERNAQQAAQNLVDSGLVVSVRRLEPVDPDYATIVEQNAIGHFPAVLVVKKNGGIVLVTDDFSPENLSQAYLTVWGKSSDCGAAKNAVY
jgi:hypothetical protein